MAGNFFVKVKTNYDKGDFDWMIELSTTTKVITILAFDCPVKLHFCKKTQFVTFLATCFSLLLQPPLLLLLLECMVRLIASLSYWLLIGTIQKTFKL
jgi:hypothetical protein